MLPFFVLEKDDRDAVQEDVPVLLVSSTLPCFCPPFPFLVQGMEGGGETGMWPGKGRGFPIGYNHQKQAGISLSKSKKVGRGARILGQSEDKLYLPRKRRQRWKVL